MRFYTSFVVRCWVLEEPGLGRRSIVDLEHIQTGDHYRVTSLTEAQRQMDDTCKAVSSSRLASRQENSGEDRRLDETF
ncbi:MAG: hypothetical protein M3362_05380 [Acidobacteriota bacterium]|nr:hypothetical protein [Acidobacteriota bacterium]